MFAPSQIDDQKTEELKKAVIAFLDTNPSPNEFLDLLLNHHELHAIILSILANRPNSITRIQYVMWRLPEHRLEAAKLLIALNTSEYNLYWIFKNIPELRKQTWRALKNTLHGNKLLTIMKKYPEYREHAWHALVEFIKIWPVFNSLLIEVIRLFPQYKDQALDELLNLGHVPITWKDLQYLYNKHPFSRSKVLVFMFDRKNKNIDQEMWIAKRLGILSAEDAASCITKLHHTASLQYIAKKHEHLRAVAIDRILATSNDASDIDWIIDHAPEKRKEAARFLFALSRQPSESIHHRNINIADLINRVPEFKPEVIDLMVQSPTHMEDYEILSQELPKLPVQKVNEFMDLHPSYKLAAIVMQHIPALSKKAAHLILVKYDDGSCDGEHEWIMMHHEWIMMHFPEFCVQAAQRIINRYSVIGPHLSWIFVNIPSLSLQAAQKYLRKQIIDDEDIQRLNDIYKEVYSSSSTDLAKPPTDTRPETTKEINAKKRNSVKVRIKKLLS
jgi:hypothetical protein